MEKTTYIIIKNDDYLKISNLVSFAPSQVQEFLQNELDRATVVGSDELPDEVVAMNSRVTFVDLDTKKKNTVTLVYPYDANIEESKISILAPLGAALIGLRVGQTIEWPLPSGKKKEIQVFDVKQDALSY